MPEFASRHLRVFLCHSSGDKPTVRELYRRLDAEGWIDAWLDEEKLYPGQDWNLEIEKAVEAADAILVCLSNNSITKEGYVQRELRTVLDLADYKPEGTLFVIPVRLEDCEPPRRLRGWQYANYFPPDERDQAYGRLLVSLRNRAKALGIAQQKAKSTDPRPAIDTRKSYEDFRFSLGDNSPVFKEPNIKSLVVGYLKEGERVEVLESAIEENWLKVRRKDGLIGRTFGRTLFRD